MTKETAIKLVRDYERILRSCGENDVTLTQISARWPEGGSERKAMRWLGFMQGVMYSRGLFTLDDIKEHSRVGGVGDSTPRAPFVVGDAAEESKSLRPLSRVGPRPSGDLHEYEEEKERRGK